MHAESSLKSSSFASVEEPSDTTVAMTFESKKISLQFQKKFLGSLSGRRLAKSVLDDVSCDVLDNLYRILRDFYGSKKTAEARLRDIIKVIVKLSVIGSTNQFDAFEMDVIARFRERFKTLAMTIVSFYQVDFTYDRGHLLGLFRECERLLLQLKVRHLSDRSQERIEEFFRATGSPDLLDALFVKRLHADQMRSLVTGFEKLLDQELI